MRVRDVMTRQVVTADLDMTVSSAAGLLAQHNISAMPVIGDDHLVGMVSEGDLLRHEIPRARRRGGSLRQPWSERQRERLGEPETVADVMTTPVVSVSESTDTADVASLMLDYEVRSVPVVDGGRVTGIVSRRDLIQMLSSDDDVIAEEIQNRLRDYAGEGDRWTVAVTKGVATIYGYFDDENERRVVELLARTVPGVHAVRIQS